MHFLQSGFIKKALTWRWCTKIPHQLRVLCRALQKWHHLIVEISRPELNKKLWTYQCQTEITTVSRQWQAHLHCKHVIFVPSPPQPPCMFAWFWDKSYFECSKFNILNLWWSSSAKVFKHPWLSKKGIFFFPWSKVMTSFKQPDYVTSMSETFDNQPFECVSWENLLTFHSDV